MEDEQNPAPVTKLMGWQPIATAPKDFTEIIVGWWRTPDPEEPESHIGKYGGQAIDPAIELDKPRWVWCKSSYEDYGHRRGFRHRNGAQSATHWMPVTPPTNELNSNFPDYEKLIEFRCDKYDPPSRSGYDYNWKLTFNGILIASYTDTSGDHPPADLLNDKSLLLMFLKKVAPQNWGTNNET